MQSVLEIGQWILANYQAVLSSLVAAMSALVALFLIIPGDQPEKALQSVVDFLEKFSKK